MFSLGAWSFAVVCVYTSLLVFSLAWLTLSLLVCNAVFRLVFRGVRRVWFWLCPGSGRGARGAVRDPLAEAILRSLDIDIDQCVDNMECSRDAAGGTGGLVVGTVVCDDKRGEFSEVPPAPAHRVGQPAELAGSDVVGRGRYCASVIQVARAEFPRLRYTVANVLVVDKFMRDTMRTHGVRPTHIAALKPYCVHAFFVPSAADVGAGKMMALWDVNDRIDDDGYQWSETRPRAHRGWMDWLLVRDIEESSRRHRPSST